MYDHGAQRGLNDVWKIEDHTVHKNGQNVGYLTLTLGGKRVCDFFPYAVGANPDWIFEQAHKLAEYGNKCRNRNKE